MSMNSLVTPKEDTTKRASDWSITINNATAEDHERIRSLGQHKWFKKFTNQFEEASTEHIQGYLKTEYIRWSAIKKAFPRAHIEVAENKHALNNYVQKNDLTYKSEGIEVAEVCSIGSVHKSCAFKYPTYEDCKAAYDKQENPEEYALTELDDAVKKLIRKGVFGVEFIGANPQTRSVYKKYYLSLMYREYARQASSTPQAAQDATNEEPPQETVSDADSVNSGDDNVC